MLQLFIIRKPKIIAHTLSLFFGVLYIYYIKLYYILYVYSQFLNLFIIYCNLKVSFKILIVSSGELTA